MENVEYHAFSFQPGRYRRLLAENEAHPAPPPRAASTCLDGNSAAIHCTSPHAMVMVLAGMACTVFLVCVGLVLLCWSVSKRRRLRREQQQQELANPHPQSPPPPLLQISPTATAAPAESTAEYDDAVLVHLPGGEKPQFFALPKPFLVDGEKDLEHSKIHDSDVDEKAVKEEESDDRRHEQQKQQ